MPWPEDSGGPAPPRHYGCARVAFGSVKTLGVRNKPFRSCTSTSGCAVTPTASRILCLRFVHLVRRVYDHVSAMDARLDTGGWLALTRQGLSPCKRRQACLGATTLRLSRCRKRERGTSGRWRQSAAGGGSAGVLPHCTVHTVVVLRAGRHDPVSRSCPPIGSPYPPERGGLGG